MSVELYNTFELSCKKLNSTLNETIKNGNELIIFIQDIDNQLAKHNSTHKVFTFFIKIIGKNSILKPSSEFWKKQINELIDIIGNALKNATNEQLKFALRSFFDINENEEDENEDYEDETQFYDSNVCTLVKFLYILRHDFISFKTALMPYVSNTTWDYLYKSIDLLFESYQYVERDPIICRLDVNDIDLEY